MSNMVDQKQQMSAALDNPAAKRLSDMVVEKHTTNSPRKYVKIGELALKVFSLISECEEANGDALMLIANTAVIVFGCTVNHRLWHILDSLDLSLALDMNCGYRLIRVDTALHTKKLGHAVFQGYIDPVEHERTIKIRHNAVEAKVRSVLQRMLIIAEHRMQPLGLNPLYRQLDNPLAQVKFVEEIEMREFTRKRKASGVLSEINRRKEQESNRKANEAANAALGAKKKFAYSGVNNPLLHGVGSGVSLQTYRPKVIVLSMRDLQHVLGSVIVLKSYFNRVNQQVARERG